MDSASLEYEEYLEKKVVVLTRGNHYFYGILKSFDQFNTITLNFAIERVVHNMEYGEKRHGLVVLRGENIIFIGLGDDKRPAGLQFGDFNRIIMKIHEDAC